MTTFKPIKGAYYRKFRPHSYANNDGVAKEAGDGGFPWEVEANNGNHYY